MGREREGEEGRGGGRGRGREGENNHSIGKNFGEEAESTLALTAHETVSRRTVHFPSSSGIKKGLPARDPNNLRQEAAVPLCTATYNLLMKYIGEGIWLPTQLLQKA